MGQRKNGVKNYQCIRINKCQLTIFCHRNEISETFTLVVEEQQLDSGGLVLGLQAAGSIRQKEEQDISKNLLADMGVCDIVTLGGQV